MRHRASLKQDDATRNQWKIPSIASENIEQAGQEPLSTEVLGIRSAKVNTVRAQSVLGLHQWHRERIRTLSPGVVAGASGMCSVMDAWPLCSHAHRQRGSSVGLMKEGCKPAGAGGATPLPGPLTRLLLLLPEASRRRGLPRLFETNDNSTQRFATVQLPVHEH